MQTLCWYLGLKWGAAIILMLGAMSPPLASDAYKLAVHIWLSYVDSPSSQLREIDILGHGSSDPVLDNCSLETDESCPAGAYFAPSTAAAGWVTSIDVDVNIFSSESHMKYFLF